MSASSTLLVVRHGETQANSEGVWHGSIDTPLSPRGRAQAASVAAFLGESYAGAAAVYSSDLQRARGTADAIGGAQGLPVTVDSGLREYDLGAWEGKSYRELLETHRLWEQMRRDPHFAPHGGESPLGVAERISAALRRIAAAHAGEHVVVVTHGGALSLGFALLIEGDYASWHPVMDNCAVSELVVGDAVELRRFNRTEHLEGLTS